jgi:hypothetical protein
MTRYKVAPQVKKNIIFDILLKLVYSSLFNVRMSALVSMVTCSVLSKKEKD